MKTRKKTKKDTPLAVSKLMILYLLDMADYPLSHSRLIEFFVGHGHIDYFQFQQSLVELVDSGDLTALRSNHMTLYNLTEEGRGTLSHFFNNLSDDLTGDMQAWLTDQGHELRRDVDIRADYYPVFRGRHEEYLVEAQIKEKGELMMKLTLNVVSKDQAQAIVDNWSEKSGQVYSQMIDLLLV